MSGSTSKTLLFRHAVLTVRSVHHLSHSWISDTAASSEFLQQLEWKWNCMSMANLQRFWRAAALVGFCMVVTTGCGQLPELEYEPPISPAQWCTRQPCFMVGEVTLTQPLGSVLVFLLAALWIAAGLYFLKTGRGQRSRKCLGCALVLGGIGAAAAWIRF